MENFFSKIRLAELHIDADAAKILGHERSLKFFALPLEKNKNHLRVAMQNPHDICALMNLSDITGCFVSPVAAEEDDLRLHIDIVFGKDSIDSITTKFLLDKHLKNRGDSEISEEFIAEISSAPAVQFINSIVKAAVLNRASDVHIEPHEKKLRARFRVDGKLITHNEVDVSLLPNVISRLKIMSGMDIAEKRLPQDGHFSLEEAGEKIEIRVSTLATIYGEKIVLRLLYGQRARLKKNDLGFFDEDLSRLTELFTRPHGAIFMTGPTGSGKSTTLYSFLEELNNENLNIITIEDPVENPIPGISHVNVEKKSMGFANALRHILRQDPDVIMIGEIRDEETARIAIQAAITGHVVLSTLHTNDAAGVIERLTDMGIEPYLSASALNGVISQRLVRKICADCSRETKLTARQSQLLDLPENTIVFEGAGCAHCNFSGFRSRFAVYEFIIISEETRSEIRNDPNKFAEKIRAKNSFKKNSLRALLSGKTTAEEIIRALNREK